MFEDENRITYFAETDFRNSRKRFGIKAKDRTKHMYIIGKTGMGKSTLLENMAAQDILNGEGMAFVDPHGSAIDKLLHYIPEHRIRDVVYFAPFDTDYPIAFNVMEDVGRDTRHLVVNGLMSSFKKIWQDAWSARMEYILSNTLLSLLEYPDSTLLSVNRMLAEKNFRNEVVSHITDSTVKAFWVDEYNKWDERYAREAAAAIQNKIGQFTANPLIRNIVGQKRSSFNIREMMDNKKILLINLSKGRIGEQNANLLGGMLITKIYISAMSRAELGEAEMKNLPNFYLYVDEFQNFANESFADILSEARKYKLNLTIAHQYVDQMQEEVRDAVFGNVGTMITFRIGSTDAEVFEKEFSPVFLAGDLVNLGFAQVYLRLMIDGIGSKPFSAVTLPPIPTPESSFRENVISYSRMKYAVQRQLIEDEITAWYEPIKSKGADSAKKNSSQNSHTEIKKEFNQEDKKETIQTFIPKPVKTEPQLSSKLKVLLDKIAPTKEEPNLKIEPEIKKPAQPQEKTTKPKNKLATEVGKTGLKEAVAKALAETKKMEIKKEESQKDKSQVRQTQQPKQFANQAPSRISEDPPRKPKEIPEEVLRKILQ